MKIQIRNGHKNSISSHHRPLTRLTEEKRNQKNKLKIVDRSRDQHHIANTKVGIKSQEQQHARTPDGNASPPSSTLLERGFPYERQ
jgi:hypothetical protein